MVSDMRMDGVDKRREAAVVVGHEVRETLLGPGSGWSTVIGLEVGKDRTLVVYAEQFPTRALAEEYMVLRPFAKPNEPIVGLEHHTSRYRITGDTFRRSRSLPVPDWLNERRAQINAEVHELVQLANAKVHECVSLDGEHIDWSKFG